MGIVYVLDGKPFVYEAVGPVKLTSLNDWIARGKNEHVVVKRLKDSEGLLTPSALRTMKDAGELLRGKPYDIRFEWSDTRIYCSELVWKIYNSINIQIGELESFDDFDLSSSEAQQLINKRYPKGLPRDEPVISPATMFDSHMLTEVFRQ